MSRMSVLMTITGRKASASIVQDFSHVVDVRQGLQTVLFEFGTATEQEVSAVVFPIASDTAIRITQVAEGDGIGWASRLTSGTNFTIEHQATLLLRVMLRFADTLDAECTFFHNTAGPHADIRVQSAWVAVHGRVAHDIPLMGKPVEASNLVRTGVRAVASSDAAIIGLNVHTFLIMRGRIDWTNRFAGCVVTVLTGNRLIAQLGIIDGTAEVTVNANPVHLATDHHLFAADLRDVILKVASDGTSTATDATLEVDAHTPAII